MTKTTRWLTTLLPAAALLLSTTAAGAQGPAPRRAQQVPPTGAEDAAAPPTPIELQGLQTLEAITSRSIAGLTFARRPDGTLAIDLQGRFQHLLLAAPGADGRLDVSCHTGSDPLPVPAMAIPAWRPVRNESLRPLDVTALKARLPRRTVAPLAPEQK